MNDRMSNRSRQNNRKRKPYRPPELTVYGDIRGLTKSKKGKKGDGARKPATRTNGGNA